MRSALRKFPLQKIFGDVDVVLKRIQCLDDASFVPPYPIRFS